MAEGTAQLIGIQPWLFNIAHVYRLDPPVTAEGFTTDHVIVSVGVWDGVEAAAFACDAEANLLPEPDSRTIAAQVHGSMNHDDAITRGLGYELLPPADPLKEFANEGLPREPETAEEWRAFAADWNERLEQNTRELRERTAELAEHFAETGELP